MNEAEARRRIETLELAASRLVTVSALASVANASGRVGTLQSPAGHWFV